MKTWLKITDASFSLTLHVQPGARKTEIAGEHGEALKIRLAAPPVEGKANAALLAWLAACFSVAKRDVALMSGEKNRHKIVAVAARLDEAEILRILGQ